NGVFRYNATSAFPNQNYNSSNYWVDVVFNAGGTAPVGITINPTSVTLSANQQQNFTATVQNASDTSVTWNLAGPGTLMNGLYKAPMSITPGQTTATVTATSNADITKSAQATVTLSTSSGAPITIWPSTATPTTAAWADSSPIEVGVKFRSDVAG